MYMAVRDKAEVSLLAAVFCMSEAHEKIERDKEYFHTFIRLSVCSNFLIYIMVFFNLQLKIFQCACPVVLCGAHSYNDPLIFQQA